MSLTCLSENHMPQAEKIVLETSQRTISRGIKLLLLFSHLILLTPAMAQAQEPPRIIKEQSGNITNYRTQGNLEPTRSINCLPITKIQNTFTPPDIYQGVTKCLSEENYEFAVKLFMLAGIYSRFDAERVTDKSARQARTVLIMNTLSTQPEDKKSKFSAAADRMTKTPEILSGLCKDVMHVGMPNYYPNYMILHGMNAFLSNPNQDALVKNFDSSGTWKKLQSTYLHCPS